jgi:uncharacterized protein (DUF58 family)
MAEISPHAGDAGLAALTGLDTQTLAEIERLQLRVRDVVAGSFAGIHRSRRHGTSIEFSEHKLYAPGDDIRHINWRAYAKTDRYHVKKFEDETNVMVELLVDGSGSMGFVSDGCGDKLSFAKLLAGALAYLALRQGDAVGLTTLGAGLAERVTARSHTGQLLELMVHLAALKAQGPTALSRCLREVGERAARRTFFIVISDLFDPDPGLIHAFRLLTARHHDVAVLHLLAPEELTFPYENPALFASLEDPRRLFLHPRALRSRFVRQMQAYLAQTERALRDAQIEYLRIAVSDPPAQVLATFLSGRDRRD